MKAEKSTMTAKKEKTLATRRGIVLITVLAVLILVVNIVTASFSWFTPKTVDGIGLSYKAVTYNRSENCEFSTTVGKKLTSADLTGDNSGKYIDEMVYNQSTVDSSVGSVTLSNGKVVSATINAGKTMYFETSIVNADEQYATDVSLYFASFGEAGCNLSVAVTMPSNTVRKVTGAQTDFCLLRNAYVKLKDDNDVDGPGLLQVEWFITNNGSSPVTLKLDLEKNGGANANMYLMYN